MRKVYHKIIHIAGNVITVEADDVSYNELAEECFSGYDERRRSSCYP